MSDMERINAIITTLLEAAMAEGMGEDFAENIHFDIMVCIADGTEKSAELVARRLVEVANHE